MAEKKKAMSALVQEIELNGVDAEIARDEIILSKNGKQIKRKINNRIEVVIENGRIILKTKKSTKRERKTLYSLKAHIKNAIEGLITPFKYKLQAVSVHFPMTLEIDKTNNTLIIKNFLGEKKPRIINILPDVEISVNKDKIEIQSADIEKAGQTAANIEKGSKIRERDRRVFQDGIFITEKPGVIFS